MTGPIYYEGVTTRRILDQIARQRGWDPTRYAIAPEELARMCQLASQALEAAWRFAPWPQLTLTQRVAYRPDWTPEETYEEGAQVYHRGGYHEALRDDVTSEPGAAGADADWTRCEAWMVCGISYVRYGIDEIDLARGVYALDPDRRADALPLPAGRVAYGAVVRQRPGDPFVARPFVRYRPVPPRLSSAAWSAGETYRPGDLVLAPDGDTYEAIAENTGIEPRLCGDDAARAAWTPRRAPRMFESYIVQSAAAELATDDSAQAPRRARADAELARLAETCLRQPHDGARATIRVFR